MKNLYSDRVLSFLSVSRATKLDALTLTSCCDHTPYLLVDIFYLPSDTNNTRKLGETKASAGHHDGFK
ncbi:MAG: hypothetical protein KME30_32930 [Iphinoe sp. HA4291-MV1]|jgi:hypothetical protein|nr:hypothetical protein [Iphinoe sp. HA4291-MV1]